MNTNILLDEVSAELPQLEQQCDDMAFLCNDPTWVAAYEAANNDLCCGMSKMLNDLQTQLDEVSEPSPLPSTPYWNATGIVYLEQKKVVPLIPNSQRKVSDLLYALLEKIYK